MFIRNKTRAEKRDRKGLISYFLLERGDAGQDELAVTWVYIAPGKKQPLHSHAEQQVYVVIEGHGVVHVDEDSQSVKSGDLIYIPSNAVHGMENTGDTPLSYISAASPAFDLRQVYDRGPLSADSYEESDS
jgi:mannose-6-phosphate isomerase-like protein (cupin superfamily)